VYRVSYHGELKALKWYYNNEVFYNKKDFIHNLQSNIDNGSPSPEFLWPIDRTTMTSDGQFGYVMELAPSDYVEANHLFIKPGLFSSFKRIVDACLNIVRAFTILHDAGYVYRDISGGNFFINPQTGGVLIADNDNVAPSNHDTGIRGTPRFMAPEIVTTNMNPQEKSDRHSLAVIIFYLLLMHHPLEGRRLDMLDAAGAVSLYGTDSLFIFDPYDNSNGIYDPDGQNNALRIWPLLPQHMKDFFCRAFSRKALSEGRGRPSEIEWIRELVRLRSEIVTCPHCGNEVFLDEARACRCDNPSCGATVESPLRAEISTFNYSLPWVDDSRLYMCQSTLVCSPAHATDPLVWVLSSNGDKGELGMLNISKNPWRVKEYDTMTVVPPDAAANVRPGMELVFGDQIIRIRSNS
jgi:serine/threonine protein kinase